MPTKPSFEKNSTTLALSTTATTESATWNSIRAINSATDAQKLKHVRIAYVLQHSAGQVRALLELMKWPEGLTPTTSEPANTDTQIFVQRPLTADSSAVHYGFLRWPSVIVKPGEELYLGLRILTAGSGTTKLDGSVTWLETVV